MHKTKTLKIAFSSQGKDLESLLETRFGRCSGFIVADLQSMEFQWIENSQNQNAAQGAGIQSAQNVIDSGAHVLISGHCGPKAFRVLSAAGIPIYLSEAKPLFQLIELFKEDQLQELKSPDVEGHWA